MVAFGIVALTGGVVALWSATTTSRTSSRAISLLAFAIAIILFGAYCVLSALKSCVVLFADRIEDHGVFVTKELSRDQILGRRFQKTRNSPGVLVLEPREGASKLKIGLIFKADQAFQEWMQSLPDLDAQELKASEQEIAGGLGGSSLREERLEELARGRKLAKGLSLAAFVIAGWAWIYPRPYGLAVTLLILLPWLAVLIVARSDGIFRIDQRKNDAHPSVGTLFIIPGLILAMRVLNDLHVLNWKAALYVSIGIALALWVTAAKVDGSLRARPISLVLLLLITCAYGYGAGMEINALLDRSAGAVYSARVMRKHVSSGSRHVSYELTLNSAEFPALNGNVSVPSPLYRSVTVGDSVCASVKRGALNVPWFMMQRCY